MYGLLSAVRRSLRRGDAEQPVSTAGRDLPTQTPKRTNTSLSRSEGGRLPTPADAAHKRAGATRANTCGDRFVTN
jgi:hypothetical protein